jgi:hypothetical protein
VPLDTHLRGSHVGNHETAFRFREGVRHVPCRLVFLVLGLLTLAAVPAPGQDGDCSGQYRTQSQGGWGADAGGNNPGAYRDAYFDAAFPTGLVIGGDAAGVAGPSVLLTSSEAVRMFLPQGDAPGALSADATDPISTAAGVRAGFRGEREVLYSPRVMDTQMDTCSGTLKGGGTQQPGDESQGSARSDTIYLVTQAGPSSGGDHG